MLKLAVLLAVLAYVSAAPALVSSPAVVARVVGPEAPANTAHAAHVAAVAPVVTYAAPLTYSAYAYSPYSVAAYPYARTYYAY